MKRVRFYKRSENYLADAIATLPDERAALAISDKLAVEVEGPPTVGEGTPYCTKRIRCVADCGPKLPEGAAVTLLEAEADALIEAGRAKEFPVTSTDATFGSVLGESYAGRVARDGKLRRESAQARYAEIVLRSPDPEPDDTVELAALLAVTGYTQSQFEDDIRSAQVCAELSANLARAEAEFADALAEKSKPKNRRFDVPADVLDRVGWGRRRLTDARVKLRIAQAIAKRLFLNGPTVDQAVQEPSDGVPPEVNFVLSKAGV